jgi:hypothetical protein
MGKPQPVDMHVDISAFTHLTVTPHIRQYELELSTMSLRFMLRLIV